MSYKIELGQLIDERFLIKGIIGMGGSGAVYSAWHEIMHIPLAIKIVDVSSTDEETIKRIERECSIGGKLSGTSGVVRVLDALRKDHHLLIVMDYMEGGDLAGRIRQGAISFEQALTWALALCDTLEQVHRLEIIHRDIKPQNILIDGHNHVHLCDFGIAHVSRSHLTAGIQPGTPAYKAPELDTGGQATAAADVYSLCAVLFELWTGRQYAEYKALKAVDVRAEMLELLTHDHAVIAAHCRERLAEVLLTGLAPLEQRATLQAMQQELQQVQYCLTRQPAPPAPSPAPAPARPSQPRRLSTNPTPRPGTAAGSTAVVDWLVQDIQRAFQEEIWNATGRTLFFWHDPHREWQAIIPLLEERIPLLVDRGSLLEMRYHLEQRGEHEPVVFYLRRPTDAVDYLTPYRLLGRTLESMSPYDVLRRHGVSFPRSGQERQRVQPLLPQLLAASIGRGDHFWQGVNTYDDVRARLLSSDGQQLQERVFRFLVAPVATWEDLQSQNHLSLFADEMQQRYGYTKETDDPEAFALGLVASWCLVDLFVSYERPASFPARDALPASAVWQECRTTLHAFLNDRRFQARAVQMASEVERQYQQVMQWARDQEKTLHDAPLLGIVEIAWDRTVEFLNACQQRDELLALLRSRLPTFREASQGFWAHQGQIPGWELLVRGAELILAAETACELSTMLNDPGELVNAYTNQWCSIDKDYWQYRAQAEATRGQAPLTHQVGQCYRRYVEYANRAWSAVLAHERTWPPAGTPAPQWEIWSTIEATNERRAVFFVDALRYDLACAILAAFEQRDLSLSLEPRLAGLPSITPLGMAALLPDAAKQRISWEGGHWHIVSSRHKENLAEKSARRDVLERQKGGGATMDLDVLLQSQTRISNDTQRLYVFSSEIDALGENVSPVVFDTLHNLVQRLIQGIRKVLDAGFEAVHLVTDHGFLLVEQVSDSDKVAPPSVPVLKRDQRYALGRDLPEHSDVLRFPVRNSDDLWAYYPYGIAAFTTPGPYAYSHGGPTLHEVIIPHLTVRTSKAQQRVQVQLVAPDQIHNAIFRIEVHPRASTMFDLERDVRIAIERPDGTRLREITETVGSTGGVSPNLRLTPADRLQRGSSIIIVVRDAQTGEELDRHESHVQVELDL